MWAVRPATVEPAYLAAYRGLLTPDEEARAARYRFDEHRREYLVTRALVRTTLSRYRDVAPKDWRFTANAYGRPSTSPACGLEFNLSNTLSLVVCAVSEHRELGVDVEPLARAKDILEVAETVFTDVERAELRALDAAGAADRAVSLWTLKEAYMKARGMGMSLPPKEISLGFPSGGAPFIEVAAPYADGRTWSLRTVDVDEHRLALAVAAPSSVELLTTVRIVIPELFEGGPRES